MKKTALGRGLGALIADVNSAELASICEIPMSKISVNPYQPRSTFDEEALEELADSIKNIGLIQPITVRKTDDDRYQIISGERRFRASQIAGLARIPAYVRIANDNDMLEMAIVENIQRENLDAIEIAISFQRLIEECNLTQEAMADRVGKKRATVTNYLRLLKLPAEIQLAIRDKKITMGHAKALLSLTKPSQQSKLCKQIIDKDLSVREIESKIKKLSDNKVIKKEYSDFEADDSYLRLVEILGKYFDNNISLKRDSTGHGSLTIRFKNDNEVINFLKTIEKAKI